MCWIEMLISKSNVHKVLLVGLDTSETRLVLAHFGFSMPDELLKQPFRMEKRIRFSIFDESHEVLLNVFICPALETLDQLVYENWTMCILLSTGVPNNVSILSEFLMKASFAAPNLQSFSDPSFSFQTIDELRLFLRMFHWVYFTSENPYSFSLPELEYTNSYPLSYYSRISPQLNLTRILQILILNYLETKKEFVLKLALKLTKNEHLSLVELNFLMKEGDHHIREILELYLPPDHPILIQLSKKLSTNISHEWNLL